MKVCQARSDLMVCLESAPLVLLDIQAQVLEQVLQSPSLATHSAFQWKKNQMACLALDTLGPLGLDIQAPQAPRVLALVQECPTKRKTMAFQSAQSGDSEDPQAKPGCLCVSVHIGARGRNNIPCREAKQDQHAMSDGYHGGKISFYKKLVDERCGARR